MCGGTLSLEDRAHQIDQVGGRAGFERGQPSEPPIPSDVLNCPSPKDLAKESSKVSLENFSQYTIKQAYDNIVGATADGTPAVSRAYAGVKSGVDEALIRCQQGLAAFEQAPIESSWSGATQEQALKNLSAFFDTISKISDCVGKLHELTDTFSNTIKNTRDAIVPKYALYQADIKDDPHNRDVYDYAFNRYAQSVMTGDYASNIAHISNTPRDFPAAPPEVTPPPAPPSPPTNDPRPQTPGGGPVGGGASMPSTPKLADAVNFPTTPQGLDSLQPQSLASSELPSNPSGATASPSSGLDALNALAGPAQSLASPLQSALGEAANAGKQGNLGGLGAVPKLPAEGALALPKGAKGGGGAGGGGAGLRGLAPGKSAGAPSTAAVNNSARVMPAGSRAGLTGASGAGAMGAPGAGAPGGGHAGAPGGAHQPNKALRRKKNGELLIGDAEAVVPVLGEPARAEGAKQEAT